MDENLKNKTLYKWELISIKTIPMILAAITLLNIIFSYFDIDAPILSYIGGVSLFPLIFLYLSSVVFRFCIYHRLFLHYVSLNWILNIIDYYIGIPVSNKNMFLIYIIITGVFLFLILYFHQKCKKDGSLKI